MNLSFRRTLFALLQKSAGLAHVGAVHEPKFSHLSKRSLGFFNKECPLATLRAGVLGKRLSKLGLQKAHPFFQRLNLISQRA